MLPLARTSLLMLLLLGALTGALYPALVTMLAQLAFPAEASGSLVRDGRMVVGSSLIGQPFDDPAYFWSRPSATSPCAYDAAASSGSNLGPTSPALRDAIAARVARLRAADPDSRLAIPVDLVTASASGLDPHISPAAAYYQVGRVARARGLSVETVRALVAAATEERTFGVLGERRVDVLALNLALDRLSQRVSQ